MYKCRCGYETDDEDIMWSHLENRHDDAVEEMLYGRYLDDVINRLFDGMVEVIKDGA